MKTRTYTMRARGRSVEQTRTRIAEAMFELVGSRRLADISLEDVAARAGVSVQTVLRHFGSRSGLIEGVSGYATARVEAERTAPVGDVDGAVRVLVDHYEQRGQSALLFLAQEDEDPVMARITERGKAMHRTWVSTVFGPQVEGDEAALDLLVVATDVYAWKLLRLDRRLSRRQTEDRMVRLVRAVLTAPATAGKEN
jgi:AcrR family transcriptional regulator